MTLEAIVLLDPGLDLDLQRMALRSRFPDHKPLEEHIGASKTAKLSADTLRVPLLHGAKALQGHRAPLEECDKASISTLGRRRKFKKSYEALRPYFRQADLLGITTLSGIARYLTENGVPMPSGTMGEWKASQVKRAQEWLGVEEGS